MNPATAQDFRELVSLVERGGVCVLSGAGMSTASGIPDYRGPTSRDRNSAPIQHQDFVRHEATRLRYWARSTVGWPWMQAREPNDAHRAVATLQASGHVGPIITQNVDGLHQRAGARNIVELHGGLDQVVCIECGTCEPRRRFQERLHSLNDGWTASTATIAPDGDANLPAGVEQSFVIPSCTRCRGVIKPDVVFFGDSVPPDRVARAFGMVDSADSLLVLGSSLTVFSGYRFVRRASELDVPVAIVNIGESRGDSLAAVRVDGSVEHLLPQLVAAINGGRL